MMNMKQLNYLVNCQLIFLKIRKYTKRWEIFTSMVNKVSLKVNHRHKTFVTSRLGANVRCIVPVTTLVVRSGAPPTECSWAESTVEFLSAGWEKKKVAWRNYKINKDQQESTRINNQQIKSLLRSLWCITLTADLHGSVDIRLSIRRTRGILELGNHRN